MAANEYLHDGRFLTGLPAVTSPPTLNNSGDPQILGNIPGVVQGNYDPSSTPANQIVIDTEGVYNLTVGAFDASGNHAVNNGDILYFTATDTPPVSKRATGVRFGYAYSATVAAGAQLLAAGANGVIAVKIGY